MKKFLTFLLGVFVGALLCFVVLFYIGTKASEASEESDNGIPGLTLFEQPGECISNKSFKVILVDSYGNALATEKSSDRYDLYGGMVVLFIAEEGMSYYDDQIIMVPSDQCVRQLGTYRYTTTANSVKTVPVVALRKK